MTRYSEIAETLKVSMADLMKRADTIEDDLRHPLEADFSDQAIDLADDQALEGVDDVLRAEIGQIRQALLRIENGTYGTCANCGAEIAHERLVARPIATRCIHCASAV
ncbi:MAG: TraR/DksA family transcriptional regulator [Pseudomonadota bacterium]